MKGLAPPVLYYRLASTLEPSAAQEQITAYVTRSLKLPPPLSYKAPLRGLVKDYRFQLDDGNGKQLPSFEISGLISPDSQGGSVIQAKVTSSSALHIFGYGLLVFGFIAITIILAQWNYQWLALGLVIAVILCAISIIRQNAEFHPEQKRFIENTLSTIFQPRQ